MESKLLTDIQNVYEKFKKRLAVLRRRQFVIIKKLHQRNDETKIKDVLNRIKQSTDI